MATAPVALILLVVIGLAVVSIAAMYATPNSGGQVAPEFTTAKAKALVLCGGSGKCGGKTCPDIDTGGSVYKGKCTGGTTACKCIKGNVIGKSCTADNGKACSRKKCPTMYDYATETFKKGTCTGSKNSCSCVYEE